QPLPAQVPDGRVRVYGIPRWASDHQGNGRRGQGADAVREVHRALIVPSAMVSKGEEMRHLQVIPRDDFNLYGAMVDKEIELSKNNRGTFFHSAPKAKDRAKWSHRRYAGWIKLARGMGEIVLIEVRSRKTEPEWQLMSALLGFLERHFAENVVAINIQY